MMFVVTNLTEAEIKRFDELSKKFKIIDPPKNLMEIYIISRFAEIIGLRAEKDYSIENVSSSSSSSDAEKKLGIQNVNYTVYTNLVKKALKTQDFNDFLEVYTWITTFIDNLPITSTKYKISEPIPIYTSTVDVRYALTISEWVSHVVSYIYLSLNKSKPKTDEEQLKKDKLLAVWNLNIVK